MTTHISHAKRCCFLFDKCKYFNDKAEIMMAFIVDRLLTCVLAKSILFCYLLKFVVTTVDVNEGFMRECSQEKIFLIFLSQEYLFLKLKIEDF